MSATPDSELHATSHRVMSRLVDAWDAFWRAPTEQLLKRDEEGTNPFLAELHAAAEEAKAHLPRLERVLGDKADAPG